VSGRSPEGGESVEQGFLLRGLSGLVRRLHNSPSNHLGMHSLAID